MYTEILTIISVKATQKNIMSFTVSEFDTVMSRPITAGYVLGGVKEKRGIAIFDCLVLNYGHMNI
jgi:hypothetical protein